jgi:hypothetical protein
MTADRSYETLDRQRGERSGMSRHDHRPIGGAFTLILFLSLSPRSSLASDRRLCRPRRSTLTTLDTK